MDILNLCLAVTAAMTLAADTGECHNDVGPSPLSMLDAPAIVYVDNGGCPEGKQRSAITRGNCCWPGQGWSDVERECIGRPSSCPDGYEISGEECEPLPEELIQAEKEPDPRTVELYEAQKIRRVGPNWSQSGRQLEGRLFYRAVDRPDLAAEYRSRRWGWLIPTVLSGTGGIYFFSLGDDYWLFGLAGILSASAFGTLIFWPDDPLDAAEKERLVDEYNETLRRELGLDAPGESTSFHDSPLHRNPTGTYEFERAPLKFTWKF